MSFNVSILAWGKLSLAQVGVYTTYLPHVVWLGAGGQQQSRDVLVAALRGDPQRRGAVGARGVHVRARRDQRAAHLLVTVLRRYEQGSRFVLHRRIDISAPADELFNDRQVTALARHEQRCATVHARCVDGSSGFEQ